MCGIVCVANYIIWKECVILSVVIFLVIPNHMHLFVVVCTEGHVFE
jgi:hypothetical protein